MASSSLLHSDYIIASLLCILINNNRAITCTSIVSDVYRDLLSSRLLQRQIQQQQIVNSSSLTLNATSTTNEDVLVKSTSMLLLVQMLFRHGDRSPTKLYPTNIHKNDWPHGLGQLTQVGMMQSYQLGLYLRDQYKDFLEKNYNRNEVYIRSTNYDRTLMTAECVASGLFPLNNNQDNLTSSWPVGTWQPIPVQTVPGDIDRVLHPSKSCKYIHDLEKVQADLHSNRLNLTIETELFLKLSQYTGMDVNRTNIHSLANTFFCEKVHNLSLPVWVTPELEEILLNYAGQRSKVSPETAKYLSGTLLHTLVTNMLRKTDNQSDLRKMYLYSAHDTTVSELLSLLEVDDQIQVPYTAAVIIELHRIQGEYIVKVFYRNDTTVQPHKVILQRCSNGTYCPLDELHEVYKDYILTDEEWEQVCPSSPLMTPSSEQENMTPILAAVLVAFLGLNVFLCFQLHKYRQQLPKVPHQQQYTLLQADTISSDSETDFNIDTDSIIAHGRTCKGPTAEDIKLQKYGKEH